MAQPTPQTAPPPVRRIIANKAGRHQHLTSIEQSRNSRVIAYITGDRQPLRTAMADDSIPLFHEHLKHIGKVPRIDVFLYTRGGHTLTPNRLIHLLREYCDHLGVLIPFRAHSAGTTLALGANEIVMCPLGELGPVDPTVTNPFNPENEDKKGDKAKKIGISVEDVTAYLALAREKGQLTSQDAVTQVFQMLTEKIHPLALGNVYRQYQLIRTMSKRLLCTHLDPEKDVARIEKIIDILTERLYYHGYQVSRREAKEMIDLPVTYPDPGLEAALGDLFSAYVTDIPLSDFAPQGNFVGDGAVIESTHITQSFVFEGLATQTKDGIDLKLQKSGWRPV